MDKQELDMEEERRRMRVLVDETVADAVKLHLKNEDDREEKKARWHIGREIPLAIIMAFIFQTILGAGVIGAFAATTTEKFSAQEKAMVVYQAAQRLIDQRQDDDSRRSEERIMQELHEVKMQLAEISKQLRK